METAVLSLQNLYGKMRSQVELLSEGVEPSELYFSS